MASHGAVPILQDFHVICVYSIRRYIMSYYLIRVGEGSKYAQEALQNSFIAIGWNELPDLTKLRSVDDIKKSLQQYRDYTPYQLGQSAGMIDRFALKMQSGDTVLMPKGDGSFAIGRIGSYFHEQKPLGQCHYAHRRRVEWSSKTIHRTDMSTPLLNSCGSIMTLFSLDKHAAELQTLIEGRQTPEQQQTKEVRKWVIEKFSKLNAREFEELVGHLLEIIGLDSTVTPYTNDRGIDVVGTIDVEGLADIRVCVQVKHTKAVGRPVIQQLSGAARDAHACLITSGSFPQTAIQEAEEINVKLVDGLALAILLLEHYDDLDEKYKKIFALRKKKVPIEEQFEIL